MTCVQSASTARTYCGMSCNIASIAFSIADTTSILPKKDDDGERRLSDTTYSFGGYLSLHLSPYLQKMIAIGKLVSATNASKVFPQP